MQLLTRAFIHSGHEVIEAEDGGIASEIVVAEAGCFDLLLSDIKMPVMDGIETRSVARNSPASPSC